MSSQSNMDPHDKKNASRREALSSFQSPSAVMSRMAAEMMQSSVDEDDYARYGIRRHWYSLSALATLPSWGESPPRTQRKVGKSRRIRVRATNTITKVCNNDTAVTPMPVLPHMTISEILSFCDDQTLMAFRGVSRVFRDLEIPREFNHRAMGKVIVSDETNARKQHSRRRLSTSSSIPKPAPKYSYKNKVVDEENRKVWIFLKDTSGKRLGTDDSEEFRKMPATANVDASSQNFTKQAVTAKVLKLIRDIEFYNGAVFGYNEARAKQLLLERGWIDERDFEKHRLSLKDLWQTRVLGRDSEDEYPVYGKWKAEVSIREVTLAEALEILSDNGSSMDHEHRRWKLPFRKYKQSSEHKTATQMIGPDSMDDNFGFSLLLAASGNPSPSLSEEFNASEASAAAAGGAGIRLAQYSTVFDKTRMCCSILQLRTLGGIEAEVRVLSGKVEPRKGISLSRHSATSL